MSFIGIANNIWRNTRGTGGSGGLFPFNARFAMIGDSIINALTTYTGNNWGGTATNIGQWANFFSNGRFWNPQGFNLGVGGETIATIASRFTAQLTPLNPKIVLCNGGTNSLTAGQTIASIEASWNDIIAQAAAMGVILIICPILPSDLFTTQQNLDRLTINIYLATKASATVKILDISGFNLATMCYPEVGTGIKTHPNILGAIYLGTGVSNIINLLVTSLGNNALLLPTDPLNVAPNGYMTGTGGTISAPGASGQLADNWVCDVPAGTTPGSITLALSKVARSAGGFWQQATVGGTYINDGIINDQIELTLGLVGLTGAANLNQYTLSFAYETDGNQSNVDSWNVFALVFATDFSANGNSTIYQIQNNAINYDGGFNEPATSGVCRLEPISLPSGKVPGFMLIVISPSLRASTSGGAACAGTFRFGQFAIQKVTW